MAQRFGSDFLVSQQARRDGWAKQGITSGSGRPFGSVLGAVMSGKPPAKATKKAATRKKTSKKRKPKPQRGQPGYVSPHAIALLKLEKKPALLVGHREHYEQVRVFHCIELEDEELYDSMSAVPNGGLRSAKTGADLKAEGTKPGYPDILIDLPAGVYHGARIELKATGGSVSPDQIATLNRLTAQGYYCALCFGWEDAVSVMRRYRRLAPGERMPDHQYDSKWKTPQPPENRTNENDRTTLRSP